MNPTLGVRSARKIPDGESGSNRAIDGNGDFHGNIGNFQREGGGGVRKFVSAWPLQPDAIHAMASDGSAVN